MSVEDRDYFKANFREGAKPSEDVFANLFDSYMHVNDDGLTLDAEDNLVLSGGLQLGNSTSTTPGTLRFTGVRIEFFDGTAWVEVGGGSAVFQDAGGGDVVFDGGNVGIGNFASNPSHALDVSLGENTSSAERVRFGNVICSNGPGAGTADAYFYHQSMDVSTSYALRQRSSGEVQLNVPTGERLRFLQNGNDTRMIVSGTGNIVLGLNNDIPGSGGALLQVNGNAFKSSGGDSWQIASDVRVKKDIEDLDLGLDAIKRIRPVRYRYTGEAGTIKDLEGIGVVGQEIEAVIPETVEKISHGDKENEIDDFRVYSGSALTYVLINSVKELSDMVEQQRRDIVALKEAANDREVTNDDA